MKLRLRVRLSQQAVERQQVLFERPAVHFHHVVLALLVFSKYTPTQTTGTFREPVHVESVDLEAKPNRTSGAKVLGGLPGIRIGESS